MNHKIECPICYENVSKTVECSNLHKICAECYYNIQKNQCPYCQADFQWDDTSDEEDMPVERYMTQGYKKYLKSIEEQESESESESENV